MTAAEENRLRRKATWDAEARKYHEELLLKKLKTELVQTGKPQQEMEREKVTV